MKKSHCTSIRFFPTFTRTTVSSNLDTFISHKSHWWCPTNATFSWAKQLLFHNIELNLDFWNYVSFVWCNHFVACSRRNWSFCWPSWCQHIWQSTNCMCIVGLLRTWTLDWTCIQIECTHQNGLNMCMRLSSKFFLLLLQQTSKTGEPPSLFASLLFWAGLQIWSKLTCFHPFLLVVFALQNCSKLQATSGASIEAHFASWPY